jgi:outer membrane protein TolC
VFAVSVALFTSCQTYEPRPLDSAAHRDAWHARTLDGARLREFLDGLEDVAPDTAELDLVDGLSLAEGRLVALVFNPSLRLARLRLVRAEAGAEHAGRWADPELTLGLLRITESVPDPWVITPGLAFSIPFSGRLAAERGRAAAELHVAELAAVEAEWSVGHELQRAWIEWSAARIRVDETERLVEAMDGLVRSTYQLAEQGELPRTEAALFQVEQARERNHLHGLQGEVAAAEQRVRALLGLAPEAPVELVPSLARPARDGSAADAAGGPERLAAYNPSLARLRRAYEVSEQTLRAEIKKQYPDLSIGPVYESDEGQSRVGLAGALPIPILNANRRAIAEARVERELARAALETEYEALVGRWSVALARAEASAEQLDDMEHVVVPLVERQLADALSLMRLGEGSSLVLLESFTSAHATKLDLIETRTSAALAQAELAYLIGPASSTEPAAPEEQYP